MIPLSVLQAVTKVITHKDCPDGIASAMILRQALPQAETVFLAPSSPEHKAWVHGPGELWCDLSPATLFRPSEYDMVADTIVLDHHEGQKAITQSYTYGVYSDKPLVSGAMLAYREIWCPAAGPLGKRHNIILEDQVSDLARLAGIRDTWQTHDGAWIEACAQAKALVFLGWDYLKRLHPRDWNFDDIGRRCLDNDARETAKQIENGRYLTVKGDLRVFTMNSRQTSDVAEALGDKVNLVVGFEYAKGEILFSLRSHTGFDCMTLAKKYGGGGHKAAAGFRTPMHALHTPYEWIVSILEQAQ